MTKIAAFGYVNLSDHWLGLFYLDQLRERGIEIQYFNVDRFTLRQNERIENSAMDVDQVALPDLEAFDEMVRKRRHDSLFLPCLTVVPEAWPLFRIMHKYRARSFYIHVGEIPVFPAGWTSVDVLRRAKRFLRPAAVYRRIMAARWKRLMSRHFEKIFAAGSAAAEIHRARGNRNIVNINVRDYDDALALLETEGGGEAGNYLLFLDGYLPYHHDNEAMDIRIEPTAYFRSMNRYFDEIEDRYGCEVVIAAHPKSRYEEMGNPFGRRKVVKNDTAVLVRGAKAVLNHESSALNFCLLFRKPMVFLTTDQIKQGTGWYGRYIEQMAELLGCPVCNADDLRRVSFLDPGSVPIDGGRYDDYTYRYLTSPGTERCRSGETIAPEIALLGSLKFPEEIG